jgi:hypothetical protein
MARMAREQTTPRVSQGAAVTRWRQSRDPGRVDRGGIRARPRHDRRVQKINACALRVTEPEALHERDTEIYAAIQGEAKRQRQNVELIASENYVSRAVREAQGSVLTNKYAEGYPGKRYYNGCEFVDEAERLALERAKHLFGAEHANVQPHSGSGANMAVYFASCSPATRSWR